jgi:hypothetical protein
MAPKKKTSAEQTPSPCVAYLRNGQVCGKPAVDFDPKLEGLVCRQHLPRKEKPRLTVTIDEDVIQELRRAVGWLQVNVAGKDARVTVNSLVERAIAAELKKLRKRHRGGEAFDENGPSPRAGRPIGA